MANNSKKTLNPILGPLLQKLAPKIGAKIVIEPKWGIVGQIIFKNGRKSYFRYNCLDLNTLGSSEIATDKNYADFFMKKMGYPTIPGEAFFSSDWCRVIGSDRNIEAAYHYAQKIGFPLMVKPNSGSQGFNVIKVNNKAEFYRALRQIFKHDRIALVQKIVKGKDYRIVVLDNKIISAYERSPFNIIGDGYLSVGKLIKEKLTQFESLNRPASITSADWRLWQNLRLAGLNLKSILPLGKKLFLLDNANLSTGGESRDVTKTVHPAFKKLVINLTRDMGLRLCGVDLMIKGDISETPKKYWVIEINAAPGLDHYVKTGAAQEKIVEDLYLEILKALEK
jgi:D-alanine-D-alanine ligase-like ATP-grasp enzyme